MTSDLLSSMTPFTSSSDIRIHPLAVPSSLYQQQQNGNISGTSSTSSSSTGLLQQLPSSTTVTIDDVTTIFVVGFPDDMSEREFQNMFTFSLGFEAASLKWHCKDQEEVIVLDQSSLLTTPPLPPPLSSSSSSSSAMNVSNVNNNATTNNNNNNSVLNNLSGKKQMIGFARFRTRLEAMEAVEVLNGKRVDQERGTLLKAEMAKKNLHIKRPSTIPAPTQSSSTVNGINNSSNNGGNNSNNNSNTTSTATSTISVASQNAVQAAVHAQAQAAQAAAAQAAIVTADSISSPLSILSKKMQFPSAAAAAAVAAAHSSASGGNSGNGLGVSGYDSFSPLPSDLLSPADYYKTDPFMEDPFQCNNGIGNSNNSNSNGHPINSNNNNNNNNNNNCSTPTTPVFNDSLFGFRSQSLDARNNSMDLGFMSPPRAFGLVPPARMTKAVHQQEITVSAVPTTTASATMEDSFNYLSKSSPVPNDRIGFGTPSSSSPPPSSNIFGNSTMDHYQHPHPQHRMGSLSLHNSTNLVELRSHSISSPSYTLSMSNNNSNSNNNNNRSFNPADQNPPCNTLYVGNLPPNTSEEELRQLFSKCRAFKRMSFRNKAQGPMCFVEFEDVVYATQAMSDLQGYCLSNSVKGGIRLSFSKNPLFTKPNKDSMVQPISTSAANALKLLGTTPTTPTTAQRDFAVAAFESATNCT